MEEQEWTTLQWNLIQRVEGLLKEASLLSSGEKEKRVPALLWVCTGMSEKPNMPVGMGFTTAILKAFAGVGGIYIHDDPNLFRRRWLLQTSKWTTVSTQRTGGAYKLRMWKGNSNLIVIESDSCGTLDEMFKSNADLLNSLPVTNKSIIVVKTRFRGDKESYEAKKSAVAASEGSHILSTCTVEQCIWPFIE